MGVIAMLMMCFAVVCFVVAAAIPPTPDAPYKNRFLCAGLALWCGADLLMKAGVVK